MSTTVTTIATFDIGPHDTLTMSTGGRGTIVFTSLSGKIVNNQPLSVQNGTFGPFGVPGSITLTMTSGSCDYTVNSFSLGPTQVAATQALVADAGTVPAILASYNDAAGRIGTPHKRYFTHLFAGSQLADDDKVYDISGAMGHAVRETDLSVAALWTTNAGYFSTLNPTTTPGEELRRLKLPPLNWDWAGGESLFIWWLGKATQEAASCSILSNNIGGTTEAGFRIRVVTATGKLALAVQETNADGGEFINPTVTTLTPFLGTLSSFGIWLDAGQRKAYTYVNETLQLGGAAFSATMNTLPSAAQIADGYEYRLGGDPLTTGAASSGLATSTRALVILRFAAGDTVPSLSSVLAAQQALRAAPQFPLAQGSL